MKNGYSKLNYEPNKKGTNTKIIKHEKYKKDNIIKSRLNYFIKYLLFFYIISDIFTKYNINTRNMNFLNAYEITLKISKTASSVQILNNYECPSEIYINNNITNLSTCNMVDVEQYSPIDKIKLVWKKAPKSCLNMFANCGDITEIDLTNFDTSLVNDMSNMFGNCYSLTSVNFSNIDTREVTSIYGMFWYCRSLTSIDLSNVNTLKINDMRSLFRGCTKLQYINLKNFVETNSPSISDMFSEIPENAVIRINPEKSPNIVSLLNNYNISCDFDKETDTPINCNLNGYKYEYEGKCYNICPENTIPYYNECKKDNTTGEDIIIRQNYSIIITITNTENQKMKEDKKVEKIKEQITTNFNMTKEDVVIQQKYSIITITNTENQKMQKKLNITTIDLGECEIKLKEAYNISKNDSLYILKIDIKQEGYYIPKIEYEVYYPLNGSSLIKLDLTVCQNTEIEFSIPVAFNDDIDRRNSSSPYYNDICYTTKSDNCKIITLSDRQKYFIDNNLTVCEEECNFTGYNYSIEKANCTCKVKLNSTSISESKFNLEKIYQKFTEYTNSIANIQILSCYKMIFSWVSFINNYANIILILIILLFATVIVFYWRDYHKIFETINIIAIFKINTDNVNEKVTQKKKKENIKTTINENNNNFNVINNK